MLFDLRSSGRRRMVKIVYVTLAILMGGGLVLFGIGGGGALSGGLLDAITESNGGGDSSGRIEKAEAAATAKARANPTNAAAWAAVARARYSLAQTGDNFDQGASSFTAAGKRQLEAAGRAWEEHLKLAGKNPDPRVASLMVQVYSTLGQADKAATAQEVIAEARGSAGAYAQLAILAYQAGQTRKGDLATAKALEETPKEDRASLKGQLQAAKAQAAQGTGGGQSP